MRGILLFSMLVLGFGAFASDLRVYVVPTSPVVILSDVNLVNSSGVYETIYGPWYKVDVIFENVGSRPLVVSSFDFETVSVEKDQNLRTFTRGCMQLDAGQRIELKNIYIDALTNSSSFVYNVSMGIQGWTGTCQTPESRLMEFVKFLTQ